MLRNFDRMRHGFFSRAIIKNVVKEPAWRAQLNTGFIRYATSQPLVRPDIPNKLLYEKPENNPVTQRYWEHTFGQQTLPAAATWLIELARVSIPETYTGIVKSLEQCVSTEQDVYTDSSNWGNPHALPGAITIRWLFRLERSDTPEPAQLVYSGPNPIVPGEPHFELQEITELWYPAASAVSQNFHLTIGGRYRLRLFALVENASPPLFVSARIRGFRLSAYDNYTLLPLRSVW